MFTHDSLLDAAIRHLQDGTRSEPEFFRRGLLQFLHSSTDFALRAHPYGFVHGVLGRQAGFSVRLHVWISNHDMRHLPTRVHRHAWKLRSTLLLGSLINETYSVTPLSNGDFRLFSVAYDGHRSVRVPTDTRVSCSLLEAQEYTAGDTYGVDLGVYHKTIVPIELFTATLFVTAHSESTPLVVGLKGEEDEYAFPRDVLDVDLASQVKTILIDKLEGAKYE